MRSSKQPASDGDKAASKKRAPRGSSPGASRSSSSSRPSIRNHNAAGAGARHPPRPPPTSPAAPPRAAATSMDRERFAIDDRAGPDPKDVADVHVLVPVKDVLTVPLSDISQAAADSLGGGEPTFVSVERFCKTLESVYRTEFSVKVDRANAGQVLGGRRPANSGISLRSRAAGEAAEPGAVEGGNGGVPAAGLATAAEADVGDKSKRSRWRMGPLQRRKKMQGAAAGAASGGESSEAFSAPKKSVAFGRKRKRKTEKNGGGGGDGGSGGGVGNADELAVVPLLQLVEELVKAAMFSPIGARDVMMSQVR